MIRRGRASSALAGILVIVGCGALGYASIGCDSETASTGSRPPGDKMPRAQNTRSGAIHFTEIAGSVGLTHRNTSGSAEQRYIVESISAGIAVLDVDGDGWLDLFFIDGTALGDSSATGAAASTSPAGHRLYLNEADEGGSRRFRDITIDSGLGRPDLAKTDVDQPDWAMGVAVGDIDNDGDPDLYITHWGRDHLFRNDSTAGQIHFTQATSGSGLGSDAWGTSAAFADIDGDGLLDLYVTNYLEFDLDNPPADGNWCHFKEVKSFCGPEGIPAQSDRLYRNLGDGHFEDISASSGIGSPVYPGLGVLFTDIEADGDLDIYVANDSEPNLLFRNDRPVGGQSGGSDGARAIHFTEIGTRLGVAYSEGGLAQAGMGVDGGDIDNDGDIDIYVSNFSDDVNTLYANDGHGWFDDGTAAAGMGRIVRPFLGWSTAFSDFDNDGWLDLFVANGHVYPALEEVADGLDYAQRNLLYRNESGRFHEIGLGAGLNRISVSRAAAIVDFDNDGDPDIVVANLNDTPSLWRNDGGNISSWVGLRLQGTVSNRDAIGATVRLYTAGSVQTREVQRGRGFQSQFDPRPLFGLGPSTVGHDTRLDSIVIDWPSGQRQTILSTDMPLARRYLHVIEGTAPVAGMLIPAPSDAPGTIATPQSAVRGPVATPALEVLTDDPVVLRDEAAKLYRQGRYPESRRHLERVIALIPDEVTSRINLAMVHFSGLGEYEEASNLLGKALAIDPKRAEAHHLLGKIRLHQHRLDEAIESLTDATRLSPTSGEYEGWLGIARQRRGLHAEAELSFLTAARLAPWDPRPHLNLGRLYQQTGLRDSVVTTRAFATFERLSPPQRLVDHYRRKLAEYPDRAAAPYLLGRAYHDQGRMQLAEKHYGMALALDSTFAPALHGAGRILQERGQLPEAASAYAAAWESDPQLPGIDNDLGQVYHHQRRFDLAVTAYRRGLDHISDPAEVPALLTNLAMAHAMLGQLDDAVGAFERSLEVDPTQMDTRDAFAQVLMAQGKRAAAAAQWQEILRQQPNNTIARQRLQQLR